MSAPRQHKAIFVHGELTVEPIRAGCCADKDEQSAHCQARGGAIGVVPQH
jgi:hypothetical protein